MIEGIKIDEDFWEEIGLGDVRFSRGDIAIAGGDNNTLYYKKKVKVEPKFPKVFENDNFKIELDKSRIIIRENITLGDFLIFDSSIHMLEEAIKYWRENK